MREIIIAINGLGRIGRAFLKLALKRPEIQIVAVNDLGEITNMAYLLKYDSAYGKNDSDIHVEGGELVVDGKRVKYLCEKDPAKLPWRDLGVDIVVESTGLFTSAEKAKAHLDAGAKRVVITAPLKESETRSDLGSGERSDLGSGKTVLMGINEADLASCEVSSNASCTTNAASPLIAILDEAIGIEKAILNTVHGYTASQALVDGPAKRGWREGRAAAQNIVPSSTGAAIAVTKAFPKLDKLFDGISVRV
ncbi:MAG TPA: glyceraldehyde 3-phosphate dehydrogenase NAD-binding domain-containing protein, partial [Candidatus Paceibacterota bacterium]